MRIAKLLVAAATSAALVATPAMAQAQTAARTGASVSPDGRASASVDAENELFRKRGNYKKRRGSGGVFVILIIAIIIAVGVYIVVDDDKNETPASP